MPSSGIVDCTVVGNEEAARSPCLHEELQQGYRVLVALEVEKSSLQTQLATVSTSKGRGASLLPISLLLLVLSFSSMGSTESALIVEVEVDRPPREFFKGPRWVSLNSTGSQSRPVGWCHKPHF